MARLIRLRPRATGAFEWLRPLYTLPTGLTFNATTGKIDGHVVDVSLPWTLGSPPGTLRTATNQATFDAALAAAVYGDEIVVTAGITLSRFDLPAKSGFNAADPTKRIIIRTSGVASLPALSDTGTPVAEAQAGSMFNVTHTASGDNTPAIRSANSAKGYRIIGARITTTRSDGPYVDALVRFACDALSDATKSSHMILDRCIVVGNNNGDGVRGVRRGVAPTADDTAVHQCRIYNINDAATDDSQGIAVWDGAARIRITRNFISAVSEDILFGGASSAFAQVNPSDIEIRGNYVWKDPTWDGTNVELKNHVELKKGVRVLIEGNRFVNMYDRAQHQSQIYQSNSQGNLEPAALTQDVTSRFNEYTGIYSLAVFGSNNGTNATTSANRLEVSHSLVKSTRAGNGNANNITFQPDAFCSNVAFRYNTTCNVHSAFYLVNGPITPGSTNWGVRYENNILFAATNYGIFGGASPVGNETDLDAQYAGSGNWSVKRNVMVAPNNIPLSSGLKASPHFNVEVANAAAIGFADLAGEDFSLSALSPYKGTSTDSQDPGVYWPLLQDLLTGVAP